MSAPRKRKANRFLPCCMLGLLLAVGQAGAQEKGTMKVTLPSDLGQRPGTFLLAEVRLQWNFDQLMGEPLLTFVGDYSTGGNGFLWKATFATGDVCTDKGPTLSESPVHISAGKLPVAAARKAINEIELLSSSRFRVRIASNLAGQVYRDISPDTLANRDKNESVFGVPSSPSWGQTFKIATNGKPSDNDAWLSAEQAKAIWKQGVTVQSIELIEPQFNLHALRSAWDAHVRATCKVPEPPKTAPAADDQPQTQADAATAGNHSAANKAAATPPRQAPPQTKPQLDMGMLTQGKPTPAAKNSGQSASHPAAGSATAVNRPPGKATASLMLLIDASGSMQGKRITEAKRAARDAIRRAASSAATEFSVASFTGNCASPQIAVLPFTQNAQAAERFIDNISAGGGTPLGPAVSHINRYMDANRASGSMTQVIILLADGDDDCNDVSGQVAQLKREGILFRHETIGLETDAAASAQLSEIASASGGNFHHAASAEQLTETFKAAMEKSRLMQMFGSFGKQPATQPGTAPQKSSVNWDILQGTPKGNPK